MIDYEYDLAVFICRAQPPTKTHIRAVNKLLLKKAKQVLIIITAANQPRTIRNPFLAHEREEMFRDCLHDQGVPPEFFDPQKEDRIRFVSIENALYNDNIWVEDIKHAVRSMGIKKKIALIGNHRDYTSYYLNLFKEYDFIEIKDDNGVSAAELRRLMFTMKSEDLRKDLLDRVYHPVYTTYNMFTRSEEFTNLQREYQWLNQFPRSKAYPLVCTTVSLIITNGNSIMLSQRRAKKHGNGLWGLPYKRIESNEDDINSCIAKLCDKHSLPQLTPSALNVYDHPERSDGVRTIMLGYTIDISNLTPEQIKVMDGVRSFDMTDVSLYRGLLFEDTADIILNQLGRRPVQLDEVAHG